MNIQKFDDSWQRVQTPAVISLMAGEMGWSWTPWMLERLDMEVFSSVSIWEVSSLGSIETSNSGKGVEWLWESGYMGIEWLKSVIDVSAETSKTWDSWDENEMSSSRIESDDCQFPVQSKSNKVNKSNRST